MKLFFLLLLSGVPFFVAAQTPNASDKTYSGNAVFDVVITEILADPDPSAGLPEAEFVEIMNRSSLPVDLSGWTLFDGSVRALPPVTLLPDSFLTICAASNISLLAPYGNCAGVTSMSLTNTGEKIALRSPSGMPIDSVTYSDSWFGTSFKKDGGWSLERIDPGFTCIVASNWAPSVDPSGGTPSHLNSVNGITSDIVPPVAIRAWCPDASSVIVEFSEALNAASATNLTNFNLSALGILSVEFADATLSGVKINLTDSVIPGLVYEVSINNISDCAGNVMAGSTTLQFGLGDSIDQGALVLNEVLFNPGENGFDFVEIINNGSGIVDLKNVNLVSINPKNEMMEESEAISPTSWLLFPGQILVLTEDPEAVALQYHSSFPLNFCRMDNLPAMNVDEGYIGLSVSGVVIDKLRYFEEMHFPLLTDHKGISLEKINPDRPSDFSDSWHSASPYEGGATPGLPNSQLNNVPGTSNTVMVYPEIFSPDQDGYQDVVSFAVSPDHAGYLVNYTIYNKDGGMVAKNSENTLSGYHSVFSWDGITMNGTRAPVGVYVSVVELLNLDGSTAVFKLPFVLALKFNR